MTEQKNDINLIPTLDMSFPLTSSTKYCGKGRTDTGLVLNGIFHRKFKETEHTLVYVNGGLQRRYKYPLIQRRFSSPMVNDFNLCFVGGWIPYDQNGINLDSNYSTVARVIAGLKPMGWCGAWKSQPESVVKLSELEPKAKDAGLATSVSECDDLVRLAVCRKGKMARMFDLKSLFADYIEFITKAHNKLDRGLLYEDYWQDIEELKKHSLEDFIDWYDEPEDQANYFIKTGLFLGFPHETSFAIQSENNLY